MTRGKRGAGRSIKVYVGVKPIKPLRIHKDTIAGENWLQISEGK